MRKLLIITATLFLASGIFANITAVLPKLKASEVFIPIGQSGEKISLMDLSEINMKDLQSLTGKKMNFSEKVAFKAAQRQLRKNIRPDGTLDAGFVKKMENAQDVTSGFHLGGFALGFLLWLLGVLIAYLINDDKKKSRVKWAWIGAAVSTVLGIVIAAL